MTHPLLARLRHRSRDERRAACEAAPEDPSAVLLVEALVETLGDAEPRVVRAASRALERIGREHDAVLTALGAALRGDAPRQRFEAAWTWARLEPPPIKVLPVVISALDDLERDARWRAVRLLVELGRLHAEVLPLVAGLAQEEGRPRARRLALTALRELAPDEPLTVRAHLEASRHRDPGLQRLALTGLAGLSRPGAEVWERLAEVLETHPDATCRRVAASAAAALPGPPPERMRRALEQATGDAAEPSLRAAASRALARAAEA